MSRKEAAYCIFLTISSILICLITVEVVIRCSGRYDLDGNFFFLSKKLQPYHLPIKITQRSINACLSSNKKSIIYDPILGWSPRPNFISKNGSTHYNTDGICVASSDYTISKIPRADLLRIAIFGDSFTMGDEVPFEETYGYYLESGLKKANINAEVLNFGVGGYGMDQAYLRWRNLGYKFSPHIVILGFQPENTKRNLNIITPLYSLRSAYINNLSIPFSKPRFIIQGKEIKLLNFPTLGPSDMIMTLNNINSWDLLKYEYWFDWNKYHRNIWSNSKFISWIKELKKKKTDKYKEDSYFYSPKREPSQLALKIIKEFKHSVEANGATFYVVFLPRKGDLGLLLRNRALPYEGLLREIENISPVIHPEVNLIEYARKNNINDLFKERGHYSWFSNSFVATAIKDFIIKQKEKNE